MCQYTREELVFKLLVCTTAGAYLLRWPRCDCTQLLTQVYVLTWANTGCTYLNIHEWIASPTTLNCSVLLDVHIRLDGDSTGLARRGQMGISTNGDLEAWAACASIYVPGKVNGRLYVSQHIEPMIWAVEPAGPSKKYWLFCWTIDHTVLVQACWFALWWASCQCIEVVSTIRCQQSSPFITLSFQERPNHLVTSRVMEVHMLSFSP